ncbi:hypothetical protein CVT26_011901 [Gymnopilus dilepis]|uniref:Copper transport protein n=1 Tax=Gymnopilus dilepis TaxID=231916 RepID=A0A409WND7_9AGAR|nr:hypothetical protein CVT26_011901 [Gymnopilus dilepis]
MDGMAGSSTPSSNSTMMMMMVPYLHFTGGDPLYFRQWQPSSAGAIAGACIGLVFLSIFERWLVAIRRMFDSHWHDKAGLVEADVEEVAPSGEAQAAPSKKKTVALKARLRTVTPFILSHDLPRGVLYALQMLVVYLLMLAVMTFQAAFLISIVLGLGIGEILFGRVIDTEGIH